MANVRTYDRPTNIVGVFWNGIAGGYGSLPGPGPHGAPVHSLALEVVGKGTITVRAIQQGFVPVGSEGTRKGERILVFVSEFLVNQTGARWIINDRAPPGV